MSHVRRHVTLASALAAAALSLQPAIAQGLHERRQAQIEESSKATPVAGGVTFQAPLPYDKCFEAASDFLKRAGHEIDSGSKDTGTVVTAIEIAGSYSQTGTRIHVTLIHDSDSQTSVRVAVGVQKRKKLFTTEPWSKPKIDDDQTKKIADDLQQALKAPL